MNSETTPSQAEKSTENEEVELKAEVLDRIKHPPAIEDAMMELSPAERASNPAVAPQMYDESGDLRDDLQRDDE
jgi:hypothetical protein